MKKTVDSAHLFCRIVIDNKQMLQRVLGGDVYQMPFSTLLCIAVLTVSISDWIDLHTEG